MLVIATANRGKFEEITQCLAGTFTRYLSLADFADKVEVAEDRATYFENAWKKARKVGNRFGMKTLADDSGLEVAALGGAPGLLSARYGASDEERVERLLSELRGVPVEGRGALFRAYLVYYLPDVGHTFIFHGSVRGYIGFDKRGESGFGYDPVFMLPNGKAMAEMSMSDKNRISHRGRALAAFKKFLANNA
jgi:XTP/dITP diphosphohydrolase